MDRLAEIYKNINSNDDEIDIHEDWLTKKIIKKCTLGIKFEPVGIGRLERFVADYHNANNNSF